MIKRSRQLRALARVEVRHLGRSKGRSALIAILIAIPVAALVGGAILLEVTVRTPEERVLYEVGAADLRLDGSGDALGEAASQLPEGSVIERVLVGPERLQAPGISCSAVQIAFPTDGLAFAKFRLLEGRAPQSADEVALSPGLLELASLSLQDTVTLSSDQSTPKLVGVFTDPENLDLPLIWRPRGSEVGSDLRESLWISVPKDRDPDAVADGLRENGARVVTASEIRRRPNLQSSFILVFGIFGFVEAALVVAAAFAVGIRRRQREVGLLGAAGASRPALVGSILISASLIALLGSALGLAVGIGTAALLHPHLDGWNGRMNGAFEIPSFPLVCAVILGILTAILAAAWPARTAARLPIRVALSGRRPPAHPSGRWLLVGCALITAGIVVTTMSIRFRNTLALVCTIAGPILAVLGFGACSPWLLQRVAQTSSRLPLAWRLAVRDAGRFRSRNGPVVTAVLAGMAMSVTIAGAIKSIEVNDGGWETLGEDQLQVGGSAADEASHRMAETLPVIARSPLTAARLEGEPVLARLVGTRESSWVAVGSDELHRALGGNAPISVPEGSIGSLGTASEGREIEIFTREQGRILATLPALDLDIPSGLGPQFTISESMCTSLGLIPGPPPRRQTSSWLVRLDRPVDRKSLHLARTIAAELPGTAIDASLLQKRGPRLLYGIVLLLSLLTGLLVLAVATALTAVESRADRVTLVTVGAPPKLSRSHAGAQAAYLALLGCLLAIPAGLIPSYGAITTIGRMAFVIPWPQIAATALLLPIFVYIGAWCLRRPTPWQRIS